MESTVNAVWGCSRLKFVRAECFFMDEILCGVNNVLDFMYACYAKLQAGDLDVLCTVFWQAWANMAAHYLAKLALSIDEDQS
ncbi:hypothetical protein Q3G72_002671 [Acer saccharum]|nr:hypothetical protein Q3G72_002671 [Acer saccharum]